jgi:seryl-tRNA synthetase
VASANWHQDHFGELFAIRQSGGSTAHTACVGFGLERIALALLRTHGVRMRGWHADVRAALQL